MNKTFFPRFIDTPNIKTMLDSIGDDGAIMRMLGCTSQTVQKWRKSGQCPIAAHYAIFWITIWGKSVLESQAAMDASRAHLNATAVDRENRALKQQLAILESRIEAIDSAANAPLRTYGAFKRRLQN